VYKSGKDVGVGIGFGKRCAIASMCALLTHPDDLDVSEISRTFHELFISLLDFGKGNCLPAQILALDFPLDPGYASLFTKSAQIGRIVSR